MTYLPRARHAIRLYIYICNTLTPDLRISTRTMNDMRKERQYNLLSLLHYAHIVSRDAIHTLLFDSEEQTVTPQEA